jgi:dihydropteroate synthase
LAGKRKQPVINLEPGSRVNQSMRRWEARGRTILNDGDRVPKVMGIVNVTPDSFSDGGLTLEPVAALERARVLVDGGADLLDLGGESTRPGSDPVSFEEELRRVMPVLEPLCRMDLVPISIDTSKARIAELALARGVSIVNDITALRGDPKMAQVIARSGAGVVLMHMQGQPKTMQQNPHYDDVVIEVLEFLAGRVRWAQSQGIAPSHIAVDPGIGFGKTLEHNVQLLRNLDRFATLGCAVVVGTSRKGFLGALLGRGISERMVASTVSSLVACAAGAGVVRVHDVAAMVDAIKIWTALRGWGSSP